MTDPLSTISTRRTPQTQRAAPAQERNAAGGYTFVVDDLTALRRFLVTGAEGGTYYASQGEVALDANSTVSRLLAERPGDVLDVVLDLSERGANVRQQPVMFVLARLVSCDDAETRKRALDALPRIARTGTHLFLFASYVEQFRGWGRALRRAVGKWYTDSSPDWVGYQVAKYGSRHDLTHRDLLRLAHPSAPKGSSHDAIFAHLTGKPYDVPLPDTLQIAERLNASEDVESTIGFINGASSNLSWEMVRSEHLREAAVWHALLDGGHVPLGALIRNLGRLTANGALDPFGQDDRTARIIGRLRDPEALRKARVHPMSVMLAAATYASGSGGKGSLTWSPIANINKALDAAYPASFGSIEPVQDKTVMIGLDVSGSMGSHIAGGVPITCRVASAGLAQVLAAKFPRNIGVAFTSAGRARGSIGWGNYRDNVSLTDVDVDPTRRLADLLAEVDRLPFGGTDCSLPMLNALDRGLAIDTFVVLTDNETWAGKMHPHEALRLYRERTGIPARLVTVSMQYNHATIADPRDPLMLDVVGLDMGVVNIVGDFAQGLV